MKQRLRLTGKRFYNGGIPDGIQVVTVADSLYPLRVVVWVIGRWAYQLTNEDR